MVKTSQYRPWQDSNTNVRGMLARRLRIFMLGIFVAYFLCFATQFTAKAQSHSVSLGFTPSTSTVVGYNTYRGTVSGGPYTLLNSVPFTGKTYSDTTVSTGVTYYYVLTSVASGNIESINSNEVSATIPGGVTPPPSVSITISPTTASVATTGKVTFTASVKGSTNTGINWSSNAPNGIYTAPSTAGTATVTATSQADTTKSASAKVTITAAASGTKETINSMTALSFSGTTGSTIASKTISINDSSPINATWSVTSDSTWLTVPAGSKAATTAAGNSSVVAINTGGLVAGTYTGHLSIVIPNQGGYTWTNSPYLLAVTLKLTGGVTTSPSPTVIVSGDVITITPTNVPAGTSYTGTIVVDGVSLTFSGTTK